MNPQLHRHPPPAYVKMGYLYPLKAAILAYPLCAPQRAARCVLVKMRVLHVPKRRTLRAAQQTGQNTPHNRPQWPISLCRPLGRSSDHRAAGACNRAARSVRISVHLDDC